MYISLIKASKGIPSDEEHDGHGKDPIDRTEDTSLKANGSLGHPKGAEEKLPTDIYAPSMKTTMNPPLKILGVSRLV